MAGNGNLGKAKVAKNDEFYTRYEDIEAEMNAYFEYDNDVFRGKSILLPCDDPEWSEFTRYFASNFDRFGLKKLISTSYAKSSGSRQLTLFEEESPLFDEEKHETRGKLFVIERMKGDTKPIDTDNIEFRGYLEGDGDFRSREVTALRDEADIIITNPPFSLFREFLSWIMVANKQFAIIGNQNAITYKEVFPLIKENRIWMGYGFNAGNAYFKIPPEKAFLYNSNIYDSNTGLIHFRNCRWFTNMEHGKRHELLVLDTMAHNLKFNKKLRKKFLNEYGKLEYPHYDNYDAIEVPFVEAIPSDYIPSEYLTKAADDIESLTDRQTDRQLEVCTGIMGVPITFLDKYNPAQFRIIGATESEGRGFSEGLWRESSGILQPVVSGERVYKRLFITRKV